MKNSMNHSSVMRVLDWAYEKALSGMPGLDSASQLASSFMDKEGTLREKANSLIRWQNAKAGTSGFVTGLGGFMTLPVAIPANLASVLYIQIRMIAAIAHMGGYDLRDEKVKTLVYMCLVGNFAKDILQETGIRLGTKFTAMAIERISEKSLLLINQRVGFRLLTTSGTKGMINLGKAVPLVGGIIGGSIDVAATNTIGNMARNTFLPKE
jgi:uncharacterized protein (DUF697 family)